jgi:hypothetical protein
MDYGTLSEQLQAFQLPEIGHTMFFQIWALFFIVHQKLVLLARFSLT